MMSAPESVEGGPETAPGTLHPRIGALRDLLRRLMPYLVGAAMFGLALWVLHSTLHRYDLADLHAELAGLTFEQVALAVLFTFLSFMALIGYEHSALAMIGRRLPLPKLALASFATQSIAHSTGFAFLIGATLRYNFYADRGLGITDVAKIQVFFTATFTLGVATLAGSVVMVEPWRLADATGLPPMLLRLASGLALALVIAYVVWGAFFHRPIRWRGRALVLPETRATLTQIFFGVADLMAVAAALYVLLPAELGLGYVEVLAIFMASIVVGLMSHVPGSLGVFESAVILLIRPSEPQTLPLIGALLAFRGVYYLLPLVCGVVVLTLSEMHRWRRVLAHLADWARLDLGPGTPQAAAVLTFVAGLALLIVAMMPGAAGHAGHSGLHLSSSMAELSRAVEITGGLALLVLSRSLAQQLAVAWQWALLLALAGLAVCLLAGEPILIVLLLVLVAGMLFACRAMFTRRPAGTDTWQSPAWVVVLAVTLASSFWLIGRG